LQFPILPHVAEQWLTYAQIGELFGLSVDAARMRARRLGWRTQPGNDGRALVLVPADALLLPRTRSPERSPEQPPERSAEQVSGTTPFFGELNALRTLVDVLQNQLAKAEQQLEREHRRADAAEAEAAHARQQLEAERNRSDRAEQRADDLRVQLDQANAAQAEVQVAIAGLADDVARALAAPAQPVVRREPASFWRWVLSRRR